MKPITNKLLEQGLSKDGKIVRIENTKIKQAVCPAFIRSLQPLQALNALVIKNCRLKVLPPDISELVWLRRLVVDDNKLTEVPNLERMDALEELVLSGNEVTRFQVSITKLPSLRLLDLSYNQLGTIPVRLFSMRNLTELRLDSNQFSNFPAHLCELESLTSLSFADNQLRALSESIGNIKSLTRLVVAGNALEHLPAELAQLTRLTYLDVSSNNIKQLPSGIGALTQLQHLYVQHNKLRALPDEISCCRELVAMRLNNNQLTYLPTAIGQLKQLGELYAHENKLMTLPTEIEGCKALRKLFLEFNKLTLLPRQLDQLPQLNLLTLHDNALAELPEFLHLDFLQHIVRLTMHNNMFFDTIVSDIQQQVGAPPPHDALHVLYQHFNQLAGSTNSMGNSFDSIKSSGEHEDKLSPLPSSGSHFLTVNGSSPLSSPVKSGKKGVMSSGAKPPLHLNGINNVNNRASPTTVLNNSKDYSSEDDSDSDPVGSLHSNRRLSISPRTSVSLSSSMDQTSSLAMLASTPAGSSYLQQTQPAQSNASTGLNLVQMIRPRRGSSSSSISFLTNPDGTSSPTSQQGSPMMGTPPNLNLTRSSSSLLSLLNRRRSLGHSSPPPSPQYRNFQTLFEALLDELDYSKQRRYDLINLTTEDKWTFLQRLKPDCTTTLVSNGVYQSAPLSSSANELKTLLSSPPKLNGSQQSMSSSSGYTAATPRTLKTPKSPRVYAKVLSTHQLQTLDDVIKLRQHLSERSISWVINFSESAGIVALINLIQSVLSKESKSDEDHSIINECLSCMKVLIELDMQAILLTDAADSIVPLIILPNLSVKRVTFEVLDMFCRNFTIGPAITLAAIRQFAKRSDMTMQKALDLVMTPLKGEFAADLKVNCMSLINHLIRGCKELAARNAVRQEFVHGGIQHTIKSLRIDGEGNETSSWKRLENEMCQFELQLAEDESATTTALGRSPSWSIGGGGDVGGDESSSSATQQQLIQQQIMATQMEQRLPVMISCSPDEGSAPLPVGEVLVTVTKSSQAGDVVRTILNTNPNLREYGEWGLFVRDASNNSAPGTFVKDDDCVSEVAARAALASPEYSLKMVPWRVRVCLDRVKDMGVSGDAVFVGATIIVEEPMDPSLTCAGMVDHLVKRYLPNVGDQYCLDSDDFGLYLDSFGFGTGGYWLEPLEKLQVNREVLRDPKCAVALRLRPKHVKLKFADDSFEQLRLDLMLPTEKIFSEISEKVVDPSNSINLANYGIFVDRQDSLDSSANGHDKKKIEWIQPGLPLYHYRISNRVCLRFAVRPSSVTLMIDASLFPSSTSTGAPNSTNQTSTTSTTQTSETHPAVDIVSKATASNIDVVASLMQTVAQPIETVSVSVQIPLHLPLQESLDTEESWLECNIDQAKCRFHIDSFDGPVINQHQPLNSQYFTQSKRIFVELADEANLAMPDDVLHNATNIWEEVSDRTTVIYDVDQVTFKITNIIRAATLNKLVEMSTTNIDNDRDTMNILLMTYMSFTTSDMLLEKLIERYNVPGRIDDKTKNVIQLHVIVFIKNWLEQQTPQAASGGGLEERFLERINQFIERLKSDGYSNMVPQLKRLVDTGIKEKRAYAMPEVARINTSLRTIPSITTLLDDEMFVAQQLTLREFETFKRIQPIEFMNQAWNRPKLQYKAINLLKMIDRFNRMSNTISTSILAQPKLKHRVRLLSNYIKIALHLRELNNFHLLTAFLSGIRNSSVLRLRLTWSKISKKHKQSLEDMEKMMSMEGSFKTFRSMIKELIPPCIPYLGVYLKDLTFIEDGNNDRMDGGLINWAKKKLVYNIISIIQGCQDIPYDFGPSSTKGEIVLAAFDSLPSANDEVLYQMSLQIEPKTNS
ncbi:hypothetical protein SAMD00019534_062630 [Acytostelium subglobosum LB1]|uniref:hypothetical protein n=1 Tax=Acytostelium subglobosum LB1 TaxID=1410327 RepID=UPI000644E3F2|nr:hypothetical protein SAMD00019534_062630 [Acytostelium subglobosum LB1]GAM23088.1 hypothetical protein SAMD00019534_062630 [Acytostelium subglobosum LB1]|eukprot:XP_012754315.1 hypothetical protein SAMD00019534_062630 [Acytostelium subglobosum LB1]